MTDASLIQRDLDVLWHPGSQMRDYRDFPPLEVVGAEGPYIHLADGRRLFDAISSWWCKSLGHRHPQVMAAIREQLERFEHVILANTTNEPIVRLCERLLRAANGVGASGGEGSGNAKHFTKAFFADNGSTAVEVALKMALQAQAQRGQPQRRRLASLSNGYHGETAGALSVSDSDLYRQHYPSLLVDVFKVTGLPYRTGPGDPRWLDADEEWPAIEAQLEPVADQLAAIVYEPVLQGAGNMRLYSPGLLTRLRAWADAHDVYLIADEIAAGFGRLGTMLASHLAEAGSQAEPEVSSAGDSRESRRGMPLPDFAVVSKGLTGGTVPMAIVLTTQEVYRRFDADYTELRGFLHSNTYAGHALAVAAANAAIDVYEQSQVLRQVATVGPHLRAGLSALASERGCLNNVRGCGMMAAVDLCQSDGSPLDWRNRTGYQVYRQAMAHRDHPVLLRPIGDTLYLFPPLNTPESALEPVFTTVAESLDAVLS